MYPVPHAEITLIGLPWATTFVERFSCYIDRLVIFPGYPGISEGNGSEEEQARFLHEQQGYGYDLVIQMHGSGKTSNALIKELGGTYALGYYEGVRPSHLHLATPYPCHQHEIWRNLHLVAQVGVTELDPRLEFPLHRADYVEAYALLNALAVPMNPTSHSLLIGIHPGSHALSRRWPAEYFATVADRLAAEWRASIILTGGPDEQQCAYDVMMHMNAPVYNLAGRTSLGALGALLDTMTLFISNDTGPAHLACAVQCASISLFGPAEYTRWAPLETARHIALRHPVACSPCGYQDCPIDHRCLRWLSSETVLATAERLLHETTQNPDLACSR